MWTVTDDDFEKIANWGHLDDPFAAIGDFTATRSEQRWANPGQNQLYDEYVKKRLDYIQNQDFDNYYREAEKPIDYVRWKYLAQRKAWYIMPVGWDEIALNANSVVDVGCGDGDTVQRLIQHIEKVWDEKSIVNRQIKIVGIDLNNSRIENAIQHVRVKNENITVEFFQGDVAGSLVDTQDMAFDYALCCGVLEILDDGQCDAFLDELARITARGVYIEDLFERFPGGYPRDKLGKLLLERGFFVKERHVILSEPFSLTDTQDPMMLWPSLLVQNIFANRQ